MTVVVVVVSVVDGLSEVTTPLSIAGPVLDLLSRDTPQPMLIVSPGRQWRGERGEWKKKEIEWRKEKITKKGKRGETSI
jgi:hypothetical protein